MLPPGRLRRNAGNRLKAISLEMSVKKLTKPKARMFRLEVVATGLFSASNFSTQFLRQTILAFLIVLSASRYITIAKPKRNSNDSSMS